MSRDPAIEFNLIELIRRISGPGIDAVVGIGDDAAVLEPTFLEGRQLVTCVDQMVCGRHFPEDTSPACIGHKSLAVNLSDLAAMGARAHHALLSISMPKADSQWMTQFMEGFCALATVHGVTLVGGDTCRGPLNISVTLLGSVPTDRALLRSGARVGDRVAVSGSLGDAACAVDCLLAGRSCPDDLKIRLNRPTPRIQLGQSLLSVATACIDVSDGLVADLGHLLKASGVGGRLNLSSLPLSDSLLQHAGQEQAVKYALSGGDDYELCFAYPASTQGTIDELSVTSSIPITCIGEIADAGGLELTDGEDSIEPLSLTPYAHF